MTGRPPAAVLGWREWVALPDLGIGALKAKLDTGARSSALHALDIETYEREAAPWVRFRVQPLQGRRSPAIDCAAPLVDRRRVSDSGGHVEHRCVIATRLSIAGGLYAVELTLTDRASMRFRMLVGRTALVRARVLVDSRRSFLSAKTTVI